MSMTYHCSVCGLISETSWGGDTEFCNRCDERTQYEPEGISRDKAEEGMEVEHLYFSGEIERVNGFEASVEVTESSSGIRGKPVIEQVPLGKLETSRQK